MFAKVWSSNIVLPSWFNMSAKSSLLTTPSLSRSKIWKPSRNILTCAVCNCDREFPCPKLAGAGAREVCWLWGDEFMSSNCVLPLGVQLSVALVGVLPCANLELALVCPAFDGDAEGVDCRSGDGDTGDSGRRKGELRWEP
jgi:hypothetical protein